MITHLCKQAANPRALHEILKKTPKVTETESPMDSNPITEYQLGINMIESLS
jgi:hypothetical protein